MSLRAFLKCRIYSSYESQYKYGSVFQWRSHKLWSLTSTFFFKIDDLSDCNLFEKKYKENRWNSENTCYVEERQIEINLSESSISFTFDSCVMILFWIPCFSLNMNDSWSGLSFLWFWISISFIQKETIVSFSKDHKHAFECFFLNFFNIFDNWVFRSTRLISDVSFEIFDSR